MKIRLKLKYNLQKRFYNCIKISSAYTLIKKKRKSESQLISNLFNRYDSP